MDVRFYACIVRYIYQPFTDMHVSCTYVEINGGTLNWTPQFIIYDGTIDQRTMKIFVMKTRRHSHMPIANSPHVRHFILYILMSVHIVYTDANVYYILYPLHKVCIQKCACTHAAPYSNNNNDDNNRRIHLFVYFDLDTQCGHISSHVSISLAILCLKREKRQNKTKNWTEKSSNFPQSGVVVVAH